MQALLWLNLGLWIGVFTCQRAARRWERAAKQARGNNPWNRSGN